MEVPPKTQNQLFTSTHDISSAKESVLTPEQVADAYREQIVTWCHNIASFDSTDTLWLHPGTNYYDEFQAELSLYEIYLKFNYEGIKKMDSERYVDLTPETYCLGVKMYAEAFKKGMKEILADRQYKGVILNQTAEMIDKAKELVEKEVPNFRGLFQK